MEFVDTNFWKVSIEPEKYLNNIRNVLHYVSRSGVLIGDEKSKLSVIEQRKYAVMLFLFGWSSKNCLIKIKQVRNLETFY
jgi:hypothetical protein